MPTSKVNPPSGQHASGKFTREELMQIARERLQQLKINGSKLAAGHETLPWRYKGTDRSAKRFRDKEKDSAGLEWVYIRFRVPDVPADVLAKTASDPRFREKYVPHVNLGRFSSHVDFFMLDPNTCSELETCYTYRRVYYKLAKRWTAEYVVNVACLDMGDGQHVVMDYAVDRPISPDSVELIVNSLTVFTDAKV
mmetsp:Transcript_4513/g.8193  ORF Transcript_4513/g.8193 Transcript_4513/m.8193 type:complete len:195 (-) Transcript_4513:701-1285(-)|eukprot:CAMPEP_0177750910 /NCGR_PEP_ID=MMETSP0491_2-20121128/91_1 /TAXON_ID=63592 /ORGANISM="Tetraselmis chuii, Strain PLY429" /LENGTH=194 /DNA_ID=CAMNT_0019265985 /DNA_START=293 /DNA_END=877 /DNA_ORIENTATION=+